MFRAPSTAGLPHFAHIVADLPANRSQIARHLGISERTLEKYVANEQAPRPIMLALFWETRWGRSAADCEAANYAAIQAVSSRLLAEENEQLKLQIQTLENLLAEQGTLAANTHFYKIG